VRPGIEIEKPSRKDAKKREVRKEKQQFRGTTMPQVFLLNAFFAAFALLCVFA
jgi:hypothetical protein